MHLRLFGALALVPFALIEPVPACAQAPRSTGAPQSTAGGVYTVEQSRRGAQIFIDECIECHTPVQFTETLMDSWVGATVGALYDVLSTRMPVDNPGSLRPEAYAAVLAYIFELNGLPAGPRELEARKSALAAIRIERSK